MNVCHANNFHSILKMEGLRQKYKSLPVQMFGPASKVIEPDPDGFGFCATFPITHDLPGPSQGFDIRVSWFGLSGEFRAHVGTYVITPGSFPGRSTEAAAAGMDIGRGGWLLNPFDPIQSGPSMARAIAVPNESISFLPDPVLFKSTESGKVVVTSIKLPPGPKPDDILIILIVPDGELPGTRVKRRDGSAAKFLSISLASQNVNKPAN